MVDKRGTVVTTSLTLLDIHDIARSTRTFAVNRFFIQHSSPVLRQLAGTLTQHWQSGFGSTYNPDRKEALAGVEVVSSLQEIRQVLGRAFRDVSLVATSAKPGGERTSFLRLRERLEAQPDTAFLLMLGTGWGMAPELLEEASIFLEPINGPCEYNHLSVRSACAIMLDRLRGVH